MEKSCILSKRGQRLANYDIYGSEVDMQSRCCLNEGIINLGTSENKLMYDVLKEKLEDPKSYNIQEEHTSYCDFRGIYEFRKSLAEFFDDNMKTAEPVNPDNLVVLNGCNAIVEALATVLADPGDGFLLPTPFYGGFHADLSQRGEVVPFPVYLSNQPGPGENGPFELSVYRLEKAMEEAKYQGIKIKALLLCNPNNPFGYIYSEQLLQDCLEFAHRHSIHVIIDEIYMLSIFKKGHTMKSLLSFTNLPDKQRVHVIWGFSKDFCVSGFRCGILHTWNKEILHAFRWVAYFQSVPTSTQCLLMNLIADKDWIYRVFVPTNHERLLECYNIVCTALKTAGIHYMESYSGLFVWADFREIVPSRSLEEEKKVFEEFLEHKVYIGPGQSFCYSEAGWFRIVFATHPDQLKEGMDRVLQCVDVIRKRLSDKISNDNSSTTPNLNTLQNSAAEESLEDLVKSLCCNIRNSNWLDLNTAEKWAEENPELAKAYLQNINEH